MAAHMLDYFACEMVASNLRSRFANVRVSYGWQATRRLSTVARSAEVDVHQLLKSSQTPLFALTPAKHSDAVQE
jgi:hypothetical protein